MEIRGQKLRLKNDINMNYDWKKAFERAPFIMQKLPNCIAKRTFKKTSFWRNSMYRGFIHQVWKNFLKIIIIFYNKVKKGDKQIWESEQDRYGLIFMQQNDLKGEITWKKELSQQLQ